MKKIYTALIFMLAISVNSSSAKENERDVSNHLSSPGNSVPATSSLSFKQDMDEIEGDDIGSRSSDSLSTLDEDSVSPNPVNIGFGDFERALLEKYRTTAINVRGLWAAREQKLRDRYQCADSERQNQNFSAARDGFNSLIKDLSNSYLKFENDLHYESQCALLYMDIKGEGVIQNVALTKVLSIGKLFHLNAERVYHTHRVVMGRVLTFTALTIMLCREYPKLGAVFVAILAADFVRCHVLRR